MYRMPPIAECSSVMPSLEVVLLTGRTRRQGVGLEAGKLSEIYHEATTQIRLDPKDLEKLKIEPGDIVEVSTEHGSVVLRAEASPRASEGIGFIPYGPYYNRPTAAFSSGRQVMTSYEMLKQSIWKTEDLTRQMETKLMSPHWVVQADC